MHLPRRVFLDTNVVNFVLDHGASIFDGEDTSSGLSAADRADVEALRLVFLTGERAHWELAVSPLTYAEITQTPDPNRRAALEHWFGELWQHWSDCFSEDGTLSHEYAENLAKRVAESGLMAAFPDAEDQALLCHAIAYECDAFCTRDRKTILKKAKAGPKLPLELISPAEWGERIWAVRQGF